MFEQPRSLILAAVIGTAVVLPLLTVPALAGTLHVPIHHRAAAAPHHRNVLVFGIQGGNIVPFTAMIEADGRVTAFRHTSLGHSPMAHVASVSPPVVAGLLKLAKAEHFFRLPRFAKCVHQLPDIATQFVTVNTATKSRTVSGCSPGLSQLYAVLAAVVLR